MLTDYGVENAGIRIADKENYISEIAAPFIAQFGGDFVAVNKIETGNVSFLWRGAGHVLQVSEFIDAWT
jgi:hypothetical protein